MMMVMMMMMKTYLNVNIVKTREDNITRVHSSRPTDSPTNIIMIMRRMMRLYISTMVTMRLGLVMIMMNISMTILTMNMMIKFTILGASSSIN